MVGYDPVDDKPLPNAFYGAAGALSGVVTRTVAQPLDVIKIRFQLQVEPLKRGSKYHSMLQACGSILREEGGKAFWKGHVPAQALSVTYGVVQFTSFEVMTQYIWKALPSVFTTDLRPVTHFVCGGAAGVLATLVAQPFDVIRTRFVAQGEPKIYSSVYQAASSMVRQEGPRALYKGLTPTLVQIAPYSGLQFGFYAVFNALWHRLRDTTPATKAGTVQSLVCGSLAGLCAKVTVYPLDMVKKRMQIQGFEHGRQKFGATHHYSGFLDCVQTVVQKEGLRGLYKGLSPSIVKAMVTVSTSFLVYEQCVNVFTIVYNS